MDEAASYIVLTHTSMTSQLNEIKHIFNFQQVQGLTHSVKENLNFYTSINNAMMDEAASYIVLPEKGDIWSLVVGAGSLLRAADAIGIQRALGSTFFTTCGFSQEDFVWYFMTFITVFRF